MSRRDLRNSEQEWRASCAAPRATLARKLQQPKQRRTLASVLRAFLFFL